MPVMMDGNLMPTLVLTPRDLVDTQLLADAARAAGWEVASLTSWRVPADLRPAHAVVYGEPLFCEVVAAELDLALLQAPAMIGPEIWTTCDVKIGYHAGHARGGFDGEETTASQCCVQV